VDLAAAVTRGVESSRPIIEEHGHRLQVTLPEDSLPVEADVVRIAQIVLNLLNNAAKFTPKGGNIWLTVEKVRASAAPAVSNMSGTAIIRVRDNGLGISSEMLSRVFDLFTQADDSTARTEGGLGIGLTLVRHLTEMHGGQVEVHSDGPGRGSEFVIRLPLAPAGTESVQTSNSDQPRPELVAGRRILIVDDNRDSADSLAILMKLYGHLVRVAHDGPSALAVASDYLPDIILLDIGLPGMDGYAVARQLRARAEGGQPLLVALTGYGTDEDRRLSRAAGFDHHLVKPVDLDALEQLLTQVATE
jgi:CheY-like chemotaxis protein